MQMDKKEELKKELQQELQWVKYRQNMLDIIEEKLLKMKQLAELVKQGNLTARELEEIASKKTDSVTLHPFFYKDPRGL